MFSQRIPDECCTLASTVAYSVRPQCRGWPGVCMPSIEYMLWNLDERNAPIRAKPLFFEITYKATPGGDQA